MREHAVLLGAPADPHADANLNVLLNELSVRCTSVLSQNFAAKVRNVGRSPRTAADALVGLCFSSLGAAGPGGPARARAPAPRNEFFNELATRDTSLLSDPVVLPQHFHQLVPG